MKDILITTIFGTISLTISEPDTDGKRSGVIDWSELSNKEGNFSYAQDDSIDAIESLILAHACAGVDVESDAYIEGINTALETIDNHS